ncbi:MAG: ornithine carbamoyltransferase [Deltaproteobacteria bacterium]|nr:ornithine carbamoyltransferase [Deltaproteobacteria bacterium]
MKKDLLSIYDLDSADIKRILDKTVSLKRMLKDGVPCETLKGKMLGLLFDKSSTRTRLSFEAGMFQLGGMTTFLSRRDIQLGRGETVADTARVVSRYLNGMVIRTFSQALVEEFALYSEIPVINGLTDLLHPCQILADLFTIKEKKGSYEGLKITYVGDGNNIANSWINAAAILPFELSLGCPEGYDPDAEILKRGVETSECGIHVHRSSRDAVENADIIYTDTWVSMGQEAEREDRLAVFKEYQVNDELLGYAKDDVIIMHCLPAHRGESITEHVIDGPHSVVIDQAENRLHVQKAILDILIGGETYE